MSLNYREIFLSFRHIFPKIDKMRLVLIVIQYRVIFYLVLLISKSYEDYFGCLVIGSNDVFSIKKLEKSPRIRT